jgi:type II secretory pathway pseudopilin PulG
MPLHLELVANRPAILTVVDGGTPKFLKKTEVARMPRRYGRGLVEVIVVTGIVGFALMILLVALPKGRESARLAKCQMNLMQIGIGLQMYHQSRQHFPTVPALASPDGDSPLAALFKAFVVPDLLAMRDPSEPPKPTRQPPRGSRVPGLTCPSDSHAVGDVSSPFISYRANTGDNADGSGGPFAIARLTNSLEIEELDGLSYTSSFAERLVGDQVASSARPWNYGSIPGPIRGLTCPEFAENLWRGDAGADWAETSWRSTLYSHALQPDAPRSCIADDGQTALMGASSSHVGRINVLMLDGSLKGVTPSIDPKIWQALGTVGEPKERKNGP